MTGNLRPARPPIASASGPPRPALRWRIVTVLLLVSLLPLGLMGAGTWVVFGGLLERKAVELQHAVVQSHAHSIEAYLGEQRRLLELIASVSFFEQLADQAILQRTFAALNSASDGGFVDLGLISAGGSHVSYVGPFDLADRNYREAEWFREVRATGVFVSDVFLGFRQVPHLVIAVRTEGGGEPWIVRATINSEKFDRLVRSAALGASGDAYLVNRAGLYQTAPRVGAVLDRAPIEPGDHAGLREQRLTIGGMDRIVVSTWINGNRWQLVVCQDPAEVRAPLRRAMAIGSVLVGCAMALVVLTTIGATHHLSRQIDRANAQREEMFQAFMRSAKLASVGELATGLAHEINNPLAIISAERVNIADLLEERRVDEATSTEMSESIDRIKRQVERCAGITAKMLQFGRQQESSLEPTELGPRLEAIAALLDRQARVRNIQLRLGVEPQLPRVVLDPLELEQVMANLITNAFHALPDGGEIDVRACRRGPEVHLEVEDDGKGMSKEVCERAFEPFFTTKGVGHGTGLGLSVCHGIVTAWGGRIEIASALGSGTTVVIRLPVETGAKTRSET